MASGISPPPLEPFSSAVLVSFFLFFFSFFFFFFFLLLLWGVLSGTSFATSSPSTFLFLFLFFFLGEPSVSVSLLVSFGGCSEDRSFRRLSRLDNLGVGVAASKRDLREFEDEGTSLISFCCWDNSALSLSFSFLFDRTIFRAPVMAATPLSNPRHRITNKRVLGKTQQTTP